MGLASHDDGADVHDYFAIIASWTHSSNPPPVNSSAKLLMCGIVKGSPVSCTSAATLGLSKCQLLPAMVDHHIGCNIVSLQPTRHSLACQKS